MSHFFIERPIFAWVIALVIMLAGAIAIVRLPIAQYPNIAPPTITINATYPGASAKTVEDTVTQIIEQRMTGLDGLRYITSTSDSLGAASIVLTFNAGVNPDVAQVQVQNKLKLAETLLPQEVQQQGVNVVKTVRNFIMVIGFYSEDGIDEPHGHRRLRRGERAGDSEPRSRRRRADTVRNAVRHADLARPGQVE